MHNTSNKQSANAIHAVPTHVITGFLGSGKTTTILQLLENKPEDERWAILVNEFGEIGIDGGLLAGQYGEKQGVYIQQVAGGCICCAANLPMQIALNQLLGRTKPHRLLIEPTGLGHPKQILQLLSAQHYQDVLSLQKTLVLVDARKLSDKRYTSHDIFKQQIAVADIVLGNKVDLYRENEKDQLRAFVKKIARADTQIVFAQQGEVTLSQLQGATTELSTTFKYISPSVDSKSKLSRYVDLQLIEKAEKFKSMGWRFSPDKVFNRRQLLQVLVTLRVERAKAVFITELGVFAYNITADGLTEIELDDCMESCIEVIATQLDNDLEEKITSCIDVTH